MQADSTGIELDEHVLVERGRGKNAPGDRDVVRGLGDVEVTVA
jgi:hypothetical protein